MGREERRKRTFNIITRRMKVMKLKGVDKKFIPIARSIVYSGEEDYWQLWRDSWVPISPGTLKNNYPYKMRVVNSCECIFCNNRAGMRLREDKEHREFRDKMRREYEGSNLSEMQEREILG